MNKYLPTPAVFLSFFLGALLFGSRFLFAFTEPSSAPPLNNTPAPLNVSSTGQSKSGGLILNTGGAVNGLIIDKGNVGIGAQNPEVALSVMGSVAIGSDKQARSPFVVPFRVFTTIDNTNIGYFETNQPYGRITIKSALGQWDLMSGVNNLQRFILYNPTGAGYVLSASNDGNVGIGTLNPSQKLDVAGYIKAATGLCIGSDCRTSWPSTSAETDPTVTPSVKDGVSGNELTSPVPVGNSNFGGIYTVTNSQDGATGNYCGSANPYTGGCSCPGGFSSYLVMQLVGAADFFQPLYHRQQIYQCLR